MLNIAGIGAIPAVIRLVGTEVPAVLLKRAAILQRFKEGACPLSGILIEAHLLHQLFRIDPLDLYLQRCGGAATQKRKRWLIGQGGSAEILNQLRAHGVQILLIGGGIDCNDPEQVILFHRVFDFNMVNCRSIRLIFRRNTGYDGVDLRSLEIIQTHIRPAYTHGLFRHMDHRSGIRGIVAEKNIGQRCKYYHRDHDHDEQNGKEKLYQGRNGFFYRSGSGTVNTRHRSSLRNPVDCFCGTAKISRRLKGRSGIVFLIHASYPAVFLTVLHRRLPLRCL